MPLVLNNVESDSLAISKEGNLVSSKTNISISTHLFSIENNVLEGFVPFDWLIGGMKRNYFWDWVMIVAVPLAVLLLLLLGFTAFLFGCREGMDEMTTSDKQWQ